MFKDYSSKSVFIFLVLLATNVYAEPEVDGPYVMHDRKIAVLTPDVSPLSEPMEIYRNETSSRHKLRLVPNNALAGINVQFKSIDGPSSSMYPRFRVANTGDTDLNLSGLALRYWFNCDCAATTTKFEGVVDWAGFMPSGRSITSRLQIAFEPAASGRQTHVMVVQFVNDSPALAPGQSVEIHTRFNRKDWGNMPPMNDWSYAPFNTFTGWNRVAGYINGSRIWGQEP